ncbi:MAG: hypothetical protein ACFE9C_16080 [Candidatus Hodarchaeota archaeon]
MEFQSGLLAAGWIFALLEELIDLLIAVNINARQRILATRKCSNTT